MIKYFVTGDTHGKVYNRIAPIIEEHKDEKCAFIILGDAGFNFWLNKTDAKEKQKCQDLGCLIYCVRGNHEARPEDIQDMITYEDSEINGSVWLQPQFPYIRYLMDGQIYNFNNHSALVIGGAYSVDKYYRLEQYRSGLSHYLGWFKNEQLTMEEMMNISETYSNKDKHFDFVLSHTCPFDWRPTDLFLPGLDQSTVDNTMELWMQDFRNTIDWKVWLFGHYHDDRFVRPGVEMFYTYHDDLEKIWEMWNSDKPIGWGFKKDPNYYMD